MTTYILEVEDQLGSTATIDIREIAAIRQDVEGDVEVHLKGGGHVALQCPESDVVDNLKKRWYGVVR